MKDSAIASFVDHWRARWPEWNVAGALVPANQRDIASAWFALLQTFSDAAWGGSDPTPGLAKLAWWQEELQGWARGARRHPLATMLQARPAPWASLASALNGLPASRERPRDADEAIGTLQVFAQIVAQCEAALFLPAPAVADDAAGVASVMASLLGEHLLQHPEQAVPMQLLARRDEAADGHAAARAWAAFLRERRIGAGDTRPRRIHAAIVRSRLQGFAATGSNASLSPWRIPFLAWTAARGH